MTRAPKKKIDEATAKSIQHLAQEVAATLGPATESVINLKKLLNRNFGKAFNYDEKIGEFIDKYSNNVSAIELMADFGPARRPKYAVLSGFIKALASWGEQSDKPFVATERRQQGMERTLLTLESYIDSKMVELGDDDARDAERHLGIIWKAMEKMPEYFERAKTLEAQIPQPSTKAR